MPYIEQERRNSLNPFIDALFDNTVRSKGEINYCITKLVHLWVLHQIKTSGRLCYDILNDAYGILSCAATEFYAAVLRSYEKKKIRENGCISKLDDNSYERMR